MVERSNQPPSTANDSIITLVQGSAFCISGRSGDLLPNLPHGFFFRDSRFLSQFSISINGLSPEPLAVKNPDPFSGAFVLRVPPSPGRADSSLLVTRRRYIGRGLREDFVIHNYSAEPFLFSLQMAFDADFADLFDVKSGRSIEGEPPFLETSDNLMSFDYRGENVSRSCLLQFQESATVDRNSASFNAVIPAYGDWTTCVQLTPVLDGEKITPRYICGQPIERAAPSARLAKWRQELPQFKADHFGWGALLKRSCDDLAALRIFDPENEDRVVVAAGAPWFMTLFGRDSLLTSWMAMMVDSNLALGTLNTLAQFQGKEVNPDTEEQPGKILHEVRFGKSAKLSLSGGNIYYGTVDATPLFVMLLGELARWGNKPNEVDSLLPAADRALDWIRNFGDADGDGYVEYKRSGERGLINQGWKDSWNAIQFGDGILADAPIALAEVQGYVYAAFVARSHFAREKGDLELASKLEQDAADLKRRFNEDFWDDESQFFAIGLDAEKTRINSVTSNIGHCLWTGIVDEDKAKIVAKRLISDEMFSGWGLRTLSKKMGGFNPMSYHGGSVWPHDTSIAVAGLCRYGFLEEAHQIIRGLVDAAEFFGNRMPELFVGIGRADLDFPVSYPTSCSPQAWSAASPLLMLRSMLRFEPNVRFAEANLAPVIPPWLGALEIHGIPLMGGRLSLVASGDNLEITESPEGLTVVRSPRSLSSHD